MLMDVFFPMNRKEYLERTFDNYYKTNQMRRIPQLRIPNEHDQNIHRINTCERSMLWSVRREGESGGRILFFKENNKIIIWDMDEHDEVYQHAKRNISRFNQQSDVINGPLVNVTHKFMTKDEKEIANQSAIHIENLSEEVLKRAFGLEHYQIANIKKSGKITLNEIISLDPQSYFKISYYLQQNRSTQLKAISDEHFYKFIKSKDVSRLLIYLDSRQNQILNELGNQSVFLNGVSGSGKTTILIYKAVDYAEKNPDKKCILFTYNVLLAKDIITCLSELCPNSIDNLEVYPYYNWMKDIFSDYYQDYKMSNHLLLSENPELKLSKTEDSYLDDLLRSNGNNDEVSLSELTKVIQYAQKTKKYSYDLLPVILGLQTELKSQHRFDAIFVDEVQDIYSNGLNFLRKIRRDENSIMIMVGDYIQSIYTKYSSWKDKGLPEIREHHKVLMQNFRNTREILAATTKLREMVHLTHNLPESCGRPGKPVQVVEYEGYALSATLTGLINMLNQEERVSYPDIALLTPHTRFLSSYKRLLEQNNIPVNMYSFEEESLNPDSVMLTTFKSSKGLEFRAVIILDIEEYAPDSALSIEQAKLLAVAMSRAYNILFFIIDKNKKICNETLKSFIMNLKNNEN